MPGVTVTVRDIDKNTERTFVTNDAGVYDTGPLVPTDHYLITFKKEGFATVQRGPLTLSTGVIGMNVQLSHRAIDATGHDCSEAAPAARNDHRRNLPDGAARDSEDPAANRRNPRTGSRS